MTESSSQPLAYLILTNGDPQQWCAGVDHQPRVIGRSRQCEITLPPSFPHVSRRHALIVGDRRGIRIRDLGSRSGTHINGVWIEEHQEAAVIPGDRLWLGGVELDVVLEIPRARARLDELDLSDDESDCNIPHTLPVPAQVLLAELSQAELEIVMWIGRGYIKDEDIAKQLHRSPHTVRTQVNSIFRKLNVHSRPEIMGFLKRCQ